MPLGQAVVEKGAASSFSLEEEIDKFRFEEEAIIISEAKEETDKYPCVQTPAPIITYVEDSSGNEEEEMAPKTGPSLRELMKGRNKAPSPQEASKSKPPVNPPSPPPPQLPADLRLKANPELRRKRHPEAPKEGKVGPPKWSKQQRQSQDQRSRRSGSVDSQEELPVAQVRRPTRIWYPKLEVDSIPIAWDSSLMHYHGGHAGNVAEALEQPLLLPKYMESYKSFT